MKRRITVEDLQQLTPEQQQKLRKQWKPQSGDIYLRVTVKGVIDSIPFVFNEGDFGFVNYKEFKMPLYDIGQMIELLQDKCEFRRNEAYGLMLELPIGNMAIGWEGELCDIFWQEVKAVL